jgi:membrane-bound metal-dependent hydrolase YbcI (DUF457 family)
MFIGHFAVGFAAKRWAREAPLGVLLLAPVLLDVLWPAFCLIGIEQYRILPDGGPFTRLEFISYPWSHSLAMSIVWGLLLGALWRLRGGSGRTAAILAAAVVSHWVLDWVTHLPDLPLWPPRGPRLGLGLWNSVAGTVAVESLMLTVSAWLYFSATRAKGHIGRIGPWAYLTLLATLYVANVAGPPPPVGAERLVSIVALAFVLLVPLASWIDTHRQAVGRARSPGSK